MKVSVNGVDLFEVSETQKKVICDHVASEIFDEDMKRRLQWVIGHLYEQSFLELRKRWEPVISTRVANVPSNWDDYANLVFAQPEYKDRSARAAEEKARNDAEVEAAKQAQLDLEAGRAAQKAEIQRQIDEAVAQALAAKGVV